MRGMTRREASQGQAGQQQAGDYGAAALAPASQTSAFPSGRRGRGPRLRREGHRRRQRPAARIEDVLPPRRHLGRLRRHPRTARGGRGHRSSLPPPTSTSPAPRTPTPTATSPSPIQSSSRSTARSIGLIRRRLPDRELPARHWGRPWPRRACPAVSRRSEPEPLMAAFDRNRPSCSSNFGEKSANGPECGAVDSRWSARSGSACRFQRRCGQRPGSANLALVPSNEVDQPRDLRYRSSSSSQPTPRTTSGGQSW